MRDLKPTQLLLDVGTDALDEGDVPVLFASRGR